MKTFKNKQEFFNNQYLEYCKIGDFENIKNLCDPKPKNLFYYVLSFFTQKPKIDFFSGKGIPFLCENGHTEIISYIFSQSDFKNQLLDVKNSNDNIKILAEGCFSAAKNGHIQCAELLTTFVNQSENNNTTEAYFEFVEACEKGNIEYVKFLTTNPIIKHIVNSTINNRLDDFQPVNEAFIKACYYGHLDIIKYLLTDNNMPENVKLECIPTNPSLYIDSSEIIHYFIFELNIPKLHPFLSKIVSPENITEELLDKRDLFEKIDNELEKKEKKTPVKRIKI